MEYTIRRMNPEERPQVRRLMEQSFEAYLHPIFFIHEETTLVAVHDGKVVAGINLDIYTVRGGKVKMGYIGWLYTDVRHRGAGLGGRLFDAALTFLRQQGCTDAGACVEGDNPSSFKQMAYRGFSILPLGRQLKRFGLGFLKVWKRASRFLDMGYFFWYRRLDEPEAPDQGTNEAADRVLTPSAGRQASTLLGTALSCSALWAVALLRRGTSLTPPPLDIALLVAFPFALILFRTSVMWCAAKLAQLKIIYLPWDTAWLVGLLLPLLTGWPFPVPGNWYVRGARWSLNQENRRIGLMALCGVLATLLVVIGLKLLDAIWGTTLLFGTSLTMILHPSFQYAATLLVLDLACFFYPFCGFNGSRIKRLSPLLWCALTFVAAVALWV
ncbi:MAG: GNAT family N-acetyltransferase [Sphaerochaetaceae bacterium]|nr:GNAT family N-acetyltransferase [Sphaerochaetaceae bacterium]